MRELVVVRGGGDIATGTIYRLVKSGYDVLVLETDKPSAIRRNVAFSEAIYEGSWQVEDMVCTRAESLSEAMRIIRDRHLAILADKDGSSIDKIRPLVVVDAILAKKNLGTRIDMAPLTIALGPGFTASVDVDVVVETMRGHSLGRTIYSGSAIPNTGIPGAIAGVTRERVIHAPCAGVLKNVKKITDSVKKGEVIAYIEHENGKTPVEATIDGLLRGLIRDGYNVYRGFKIADIDPRISEYDNCFTISDKARCIAGGVLEAILAYGHREEAKTIYADNAATVIDKPYCVTRAVVEAMNHAGNSARGVHKASLTASRIIYDARETIASFFCVDSPDNVVFTSGITHSLNVVIKGILKSGDHVITTYAEHNSVLRPIYEMAKIGVEYTVTAPFLEDIMAAVREDTRAVIMTHGSNVTGDVYNIRSIGRELHKKGIILIVDAAQTAGVIPVSVKEDNIDILCFTGHKSLLGPQGVGGICVCADVYIKPLLSGGSGIESYSREQPASMPVRLEAGTMNCAAIAGLSASIDYINGYGMDRLREEEVEICTYFVEAISKMPGITIYGDYSDMSKRTAIVAINIEGLDAAAVSDELSYVYNIQTRAGAHCAPLMHEHLGTVDRGIVRFSFSHMTSIDDINQIIYALEQITQ